MASATTAKTSSPQTANAPVVLADNFPSSE